MVISLDDSVMFRKHWRMISDLWKNKLGITPVLLIMSDEDFEVDESNGIVYRQRLLKKYDKYLQLTCGRLWYCLNQEDKVVSIGDMDMYPLSRLPFIDIIKDVDNKTVVQVTDRKYENEGFLQANYFSNFITMTGNMFRKVLGSKLGRIAVTKEGFYDQVIEYIKDKHPSVYETGVNKNMFFGFDETLLTDAIDSLGNLGIKKFAVNKNYPDKRVIPTHPHWLMRGCPANIEHARMDLVDKGWYYYLHSYRDFDENNKLLREIVSRSWKDDKYLTY